jgi:predicted metalloprotease with PDZ domain
MLGWVAEGEIDTKGKVASMRLRQVRIVVVLLFAGAGAGAAGARAQEPEPARYLVRVEEPGSRLYHVEAELPATGDTTYLSLPSWTPGHYEVENYARYVRHFGAWDGERRLRWDKADKDTWRVVSTGAARVRVGFDYPADSVDLSHSLLRDDFGFLNGTNLFVYPETGYDFSAEVRFELPEGWKVATELEETDRPGTYAAADYHELVDNPTFLGHFAIDSVMADGRWIRLAVYPASYMREPAREMALDASKRIAETIHGMFGGPPYDRYTTFVYLDDEGYPFLAGLEHADSHLEIMPAIMFQEPRLTFRSYLYGLLAHEFYHSWNVKRIRPAGLWPYAYDREQFSPLLWMSEGITDYYGNVVLVRAGLWIEELFWSVVNDAIASVEAEPAPKAVEDASLDTWIEPLFGDRYIYYDKGGLLGLLLDVKIRDATGNRYSLDDVMRRLYREHYEADRGFTTDDFMAYVGEYIGQDAAGEFYRDYIDGREPLPYRETLALAGMRYEADTIVEPLFGVEVAPSRDDRMIVRYVAPQSEADRSGIQAGDQLVRVGDVEVSDRDWGAEFKRVYAGRIGDPLTVAYVSGGREIESSVTVQASTRYTQRLVPEQAPSEKQAEIRRGIVRGVTR